MSYMYRTFIIFTIFIVAIAMFFVLLPRDINADVVHPDFLTKKCAPGEQEVKCTYRNKDMFGPKEVDTCKLYRNDPNYRPLAATGSTWGGTAKYCLRADASDWKIQVFDNDFWYSIFYLTGFGSESISAVRIIIFLILASLIGLFLIRKRNVTK